MTSTSLNIAGKIDPETIALYKAINQVTEDLGIPYVVVGATARDYVLHFGHGAKIKRATTDIDFGIQVVDWAVFSVVKDKLLALGFKKTPKEHRLLSVAEIQIDIVPFGEVEDSEAGINWPPKGDTTMVVLGFQEVCGHAESVRIQDDPVVDIPVATSPGITLLKLVAWLDRVVEKRSKDAKDIAYLLQNHEEIPDVANAVHDNEGLMEKYGWDAKLAASNLLGVSVAEIAETKTKEFLNKLLNEDEVQREKLIEEMCDVIEVEFDKNKSLLLAFVDGYNS